MNSIIHHAVKYLNVGLVEEAELINFHKDPDWHDVMYGTVNKDGLLRLKRFINNMKNKGLYDDVIVRLYHGTDASHPIMDQGLLPTTNKRRNSYQSSSGYVYLSVFPGSAKQFGEIAYPRKEIALYQVDVPLKYLVPDTDQLANKRLWGTDLDNSIGTSLADSLVYGHGARVKRAIPPYMITRIE